MGGSLSSLLACRHRAAREHEQGIAASFSTAPAHQAESRSADLDVRKEQACHARLVVAHGGGDQWPRPVVSPAPSCPAVRRTDAGRTGLFHLVLAQPSHRSKSRAGLNASKPSSRRALRARPASRTRSPPPTAARGPRGSVRSRPRAGAALASAARAAKPPRRRDVLVELARQPVCRAVPSFANAYVSNACLRSEARDAGSSHSASPCSVATVLRHSRTSDVGTISSNRLLLVLPTNEKMILI